MPAKTVMTPVQMHGVDANDVSGDPQVLQLGISDFAVDLSQSFKSAHRQQGVAEGDDHRHHRNLQPEGSFEPSLGFGREGQVARQRRRRKLPSGPSEKCVRGHQISRITTITVVICMMRSALPLDS